MAPYSFRGGRTAVSHIKGFRGNRTSNLVTNRLSGLRSAGYVSNRPRSLYSRPVTSRYTDARQVLQQKNARHRLGSGITDLSQKLVSRTLNSGRLNDARGRIGKPLYVAQVNRNFRSNVNTRGRFQSNRVMQSQPAFGTKRLAHNKLIQVNRGSITVTAKQNISQRRQWRPVQDELEEMTLDDLPQLSVTPARSTVQPVEARLLQSTPKERSDASATVLITNLKQTVTEEDINELFGVVGQMTSAQLLHPGTALVTYVRREDAATALEYYNNVTLDGMAMRCTILSLDKQKSKPSISSRLGERTHSTLSESFLSPASRAPSFLSPVVPGTSVQEFGLRNTGRQIQAQFPTRSHHATNKPKFTVCLN